MQTRLLTIVFLIGILFTGCEKNETAEPADLTSAPKIMSLSADKYDIEVGGEDPAIITCEASGGNIEYVWEVDLGDIFPMNNDGSVVRFTGSECCLGKKIIKCTAKNDKGEVTETISINIFIP
jgi:hypothetical protein